MQAFHAPLGREDERMLEFLDIHSQHLHRIDKDIVEYMVFECYESRSSRIGRLSGE